MLRAILFNENVCQIGFVLGIILAPLISPSINICHQPQQQERVAYLLDAALHCFCNQGQAPIGFLTRKPEKLRGFPSLCHKPSEKHIDSFLLHELRFAKILSVPRPVSKYGLVSFFSIKEVTYLTRTCTSTKNFFVNALLRNSPCLLSVNPFDIN